MVVLGGQPARGSTLIMTLVFVSMFVVIFSALTSVVSRTYQQSVLQARDETAFQVAEAGLNYGRWRLAHDAEFLDSETRELQDQFAGVLGTYQVSFEHAVANGTTVLITSVGTTAGSSERPVTVRARYGRPSLARYASITNSDVWYGGQINGAVHANGGIRMDGASDSLMSSAKETYSCQPEHGCSSPFETKPGVWGSGTTPDLWEFPTPPVNYNALTADLQAIEDAAIASGTHYDSSGAFGYHIIFNANNTYSIYRVTKKTTPVRSWYSEDDNKPLNSCSKFPLLSHDISKQSFIETRLVPSGQAIFVKDTVWIEGEIRDRITIAAGVIPDAPATNADIIINGSISYGGVKDGTRALGVIAQRNVLIPWSAAPENLTLDGAFIAQKGRFGRRYYPNDCGSEAHRLKTSLSRYGMIGSNTVPVTTWLGAGNSVASGYQTGQSAYDPHLLYDPPPYFPSDSQYEFISWEEEQ